MSHRDCDRGNERVRRKYCRRCGAHLITKQGWWGVYSRLSGATGYPLCEAFALRRDRMDAEALVRDAHRQAPGRAPDLVVRWVPSDTPFC